MTADIGETGTRNLGSTSDHSGQVTCRKTGAGLSFLHPPRPRGRCSDLWAVHIVPRLLQFGPVWRSPPPAGTAGFGLTSGRLGWRCP